MEFTDLLKMGASMIEGNSDKATTGLDLEKIAASLGNIVLNSEGGLDLLTFVGRLSQNGLGEIVGSWLGNGENAAISSDEVASLLGEEKIAAFASDLGIDTASAKLALAEALPAVVDSATSGEHNIVDQMMGGSGNPMEALSKMFG